MLKRAAKWFSNYEPVNGTLRVVLDWLRPDERPASTLITNLWLLSKAGALQWHKYVIEENTRAAYRTGRRHSNLDINDIVGGINTNIFLVLISIYKTTNRRGEIEYLIVLLSPNGQVIKEILETSDHRNEKLREIFEGIDNGLYGSDKLPFDKIDQARQRALEVMNTMLPAS